MHSIRPTFTAIALGALITLAGCPPQEQGPAFGSGEGSVAVQSAPKQQSPPPRVQSEEDERVATIDGLTISMEQLEQPLIQAYGLNMLLKLVELDLAKRQAQLEGITLTENDFKAETQRYLDQVFKDDKQISALRDDLDEKTAQGKLAQADQDRRSIQQEQQRLLAQLLDNQKLTRTEFDLALETTAYLRAVVQPAVQAKLTDDNLQQSFRARYGEKVQVRHIACANPLAMTEVKRRLASGESFAQVAVELSQNRETGPNGGELPPFSRSTPGLPQVFKDAAFALQKPGDISEIVQADGAYHLIQLEARIAPTAVKFEDVKQSVREDLAEALTQEAVKQLRAQLGQEALKNLHIQNPVLAQQFQDKISQRDTQIRDRDQIRRELETERNAATAPATTGAIAPAATAAQTGLKAGATPASTSSTRP